MLDDKELHVNRVKRLYSSKKQQFTSEVSYFIILNRHLVAYEQLLSLHHKRAHGKRAHGKRAHGKRAHGKRAHGKRAHGKRAHGK